MTPRGFLFSAAEAAIKKPGRKDLALVYSEKEANIAGMFTTNAVKAAPVQLDMKQIKSGRGQAIIVNSGNANACTGKQGLRDAAEMARLVARHLSIRPSLVYVASTGVIGTPMPMERINAKIADLTNNLDRKSIRDIAEAILTTDTFPKIVRKKIDIEGKTGIITGICKGAGMICPHMATMLCFLMTDIAVNARALQNILKDAVELSFNRVTIDGDMSTNDTVLLMANGMLGNTLITEKSRSYAILRKTLSELTFDLSKLIAQDGEGATKLVEIEVKGARSTAEAARAAFAVANSSLVKTAIYGNDANWGRIMAALGYSGVMMKEEKVDIYFGKVAVVRRGLSAGKDREAGEILKGKKVGILIDLHVGKASAKILTCDITEDYIRINAEYRT
jgi:glutamate N-acetyltransferase / amino-acid N-acetyltransferase